MKSPPVFFKKHLLKVVLPLVFGLLGTMARSQQPWDVVVSSFGETQSPGNGTLCWTLGELMVEFYANGAALDQGFLQGYCLVTDVADPSGETASEPGIAVYPNPVSALLSIQAETYGAYRAELFDLQGRLLLMYSFTGRTVELDLGGYPSGAYLLRIIFGEINAKTFGIQKIR